MITTLNLIDLLRKSNKFKVDVSYIAPILHIVLHGKIFSNLEYDSRIEKVNQYLIGKGIERDSLDTLLRAAPISIDCVTPTEFIAFQDMVRANGDSALSSWVPWFEEATLPPPQIEKKLESKFIHFYGYKGGQGRSTVLALLAKSLANDGFKALVIDADVEAPSLDYLFSGRADDHSQTLMGLCGWANEIRPIVGVHMGTRNGRVDLIACRSRQPEVDLDFAMFVSTNPLDTRVLERGADKLSHFLQCTAEKYDAVLIDHRTGMTASVLPLIRRLPGAIAMFARPDSNVGALPSDLMRITRSILRSGIPSKSFFVTFSLDEKQAKEKSINKEEALWRDAISKELETAARPLNTPTDDEAIYSPDELAYRWVNWVLDRAIFGLSSPAPERLQYDNIEALGKMRELVDLSGLKRGFHKTNSQRTQTALVSVSGARDQGLFIQIPEIESLLIPNNPFTYVLGRKGTGKTRLLNELALRGLGIPLLVASDEVVAGGIRSGSIEATTWMDRCERNAETFWWSLLGISLELDYGSDSLINSIDRHLKLRTNPILLADKLKIRDLAKKHAGQHVLLIDGLETMVPATESRELVAALFRLMSTIQNDPAFASKLTIRLFIREDLATGAIQNVEQQMDGRAIQLRWSAASILNFALSRLPTLPWVKTRYDSLCKRIDSDMYGEKITFGQLSEQEAIELLLEALPNRIRRNNLSTKTFLKLYFSDAGGDETNRAAFYPRLYMSFLSKLDSLCASSEQATDENGRIDSRLVNQSYDAASSDFINETKLELVYLLSLESPRDSDENENDVAKVDRFIAAFDGMSTPFEYEQAIEDLMHKTGFTEASIRSSLIRMKSIRMFEDRPGYAGWWRVGQLFKMGLRMKYTR